MKSLVVILFFIGMSMIVIGYNKTVAESKVEIKTVTKSILDEQFAPFNIFKEKNRLYASIGKPLVKHSRKQEEEIVNELSKNTVGRPKTMRLSDNVQLRNEELEENRDRDIM